MLHDESKYVLYSTSEKPFELSYTAHVTFDMLPDDVLLIIFDFYQVDTMNYVGSTLTSELRGTGLCMCAEDGDMLSSPLHSAWTFVLSAQKKPPWASCWMFGHTCQSS